MSGAHSFAAGSVTAASVAHDDAHPVLDAEASERFRRLVLPQLDAAYSFARFLSRDADAAHDIVQDAFLKACRHFGSFRDGNVRAWLFAIVRNCHHDWRAGAGSRPPATRPSPRGRRRGISRVALRSIGSFSEEDTPEAALIRKTESERGTRRSPRPAAAPARTPRAARAGAPLLSRDRDGDGATDRHGDVAPGTGPGRVRRDLNSGRSDREGLTVVTRETDDAHTGP